MTTAHPVILHADVTALPGSEDDVFRAPVSHARLSA